MTLLQRSSAVNSPIALAPAPVEAPASSATPDQTILRSAEPQPTDAGDSESKPDKLMATFEQQEKELGPSFFDKEYLLHHIAALYVDEGSFTKAEMLLKRVICMEEREHGPNHHKIGTSLQELAQLYKLQGNTFAFKRTNERILGRNPARWERMEDIEHMFDPLADQPRVASMTIDRDTILHPILHTWAGHGLEGITPDNSVYKKLIDCSFWDSPERAYEFYFQPAEEDAANQFCKIIIGLSKSAVKSLAGAPSYRGPADCWSLCSPQDDVWIYRFGGSNVPTRVIFREGRCRRADVCTQDEALRFSRWRIGRILNYSPWKTVSEILKHEGEPDWATNDSEDIVEPLKGLFSETLHYRVDPWRYVDLKIKFGVCVEAESPFIVH